MAHGVSRRWFIGGAMAFGAAGAFGGSRFVAAPGLVPTGSPRLRFGVLSDIHIRYMSHPGGPDRIGGGSNDTFLHALEWFRDQGVDAVLVAGDMADNGLVAQLEAVAQTWRSVFPDNKAPDGRRVEPVFVYGNHDMGGPPYARKSFRRGKGSGDELADAIIYSKPKEAWEKVFGEPYEPVYRKTVKGYSFIGAQWMSMGCLGKDEAFNAGIADFYAREGRRLDPALPFFHVQHPHPKDTCYGPWAWGRDVGLSTSALSAFPNAVAFSGHSHYSLTDERSIWQGAFTSVGTSSLLFTTFANGELGSDGYENTRSFGPGAREADAKKLMPALGTHDCRQGMLWSVYDDCIAVKRREFLSGLDVGPDWVMPLPAAESRPFAFAEHARRHKAPQFAAGATVKVEHGKAKPRGARPKSGKGAENSPEMAVVNVSVPAPVQDADSRLYSLEFAAEGLDGRRVAKRVAARGYNHSLSCAVASSRQCCALARETLPGPSVRFVVTPFNCLGSGGAPLVSDWMEIT